MSRETDTIKAKLSSVEDEIIQNKSRIDQLSQKNNRLEAQAEVLRSLYSELIKDVGQRQNGATKSDGKPKATDAIMKYLKDHNEGVAKKKLIDDLEDVIETSSDKPRQVVTSTIYNMQKKGEIIEQEGEKGQLLLFLK